MNRFITSFVILVLLAAGLLMWQPWDTNTVEIDLETDRAIAEVVSVRTLTEEITVRGELRRDELQAINSAIDGKISDVLVSDGETVYPGDVLFAFQGRRAVAVNGDFAFYRQLNVGSEGPDVLQLETILTRGGYEVGVVDNYFTEETRFGLSQWQMDQGYGAATSEVDEVVTISLSGSGPGYTVGARNAATLEIRAIPGFADSSLNEQTFTTTTSTLATPTTTLAPLDEEVVLLADFAWNERSERVRILQEVLGITADGVYGPSTRTAHLTSNRERGLSQDAIPWAFAVSETSRVVSESGSASTFTVLLGAPPIDDVVISVESNDPSEVSVSPVLLRFDPENWDDQQVLTVEGVDDRLIDGDQVTSVVLSVVENLSDNDFIGALDIPVSVKTIDDDVAGYEVTKVSSAVAEAGSVGAFSAVLESRPASNVVLGITNPDAGEVTVSPESLTFTTDNWSIPQTVTAVGVDDTSIDGPQSTVIEIAVVDGQSDDNFDLLGSRSVRILTIDDESAGFTLWTTAVAVDESGTSDTFTAVLNSAPSSDVVLAIVSADTGEATVSPSAITFTPTDWSMPQVVTVSGVDDTTADGEQSTAVSINVSASSDETFLGLPAQTVTVATADNDPAESETNSPRVTSETVPSITVETSTGTISEGDQITFTFSAQPVPSEDLIVDFSLGGELSADEDVEEIGDTILFPAGVGMAELVVTTLVDDDLEPDEDLEVSISQIFGDNPRYNVGGRSEATVTVTDPDVPDLPVLTLRADADSAGEGSSVGFTVETRVEVVEDIDVYFLVGGTVSENDDYSEAAEYVTLTTSNDSVGINISLRSDDLVEVDELLTVTLVPDPKYLPGFVDRAYTLGDSVVATVTVESDDRPELTLKGGGSILEGEAGYITIIADQAPEEDTSVIYSVSGSAQQGIDYEVLTGTALLHAGQTTLDIVIRTIDDDVVFEPADMIVANWPARVGTVHVDEGQFVLQGNDVLNLTEPDFTIKMFATPSERAKLSLDQMVTVNLAAGDQESPGRIVELEDSASTGSGSETYEGVVETAEELAGVDGAVVTIDVIVDEATDAVVVPIAAVLSDSGTNKVRVVTPEGVIERRAIETGMLDGAYVEVKSGVSPGEYVILEIDRR